MPEYIEKVGIWSGVTIAGQRTNDRTRKDRATQPMDHGRLRWAKRIIWHFYPWCIQYIEYKENCCLLCFQRNDIKKKERFRKGKSKASESSASDVSASLFPDVSIRSRLYVARPHHTHRRTLLSNISLFYDCWNIYEMCFATTVPLYLCWVVKSIRK